MKETILKNIYSDIIELSDLNLQRKLWLNENNDTGMISSYTEVMCRLFDDNDFDNFIDKTAIDNGLPEKVIVELNKLRNYLNNYSEKENDRLIINDLEWDKIAKQAKIVLNHWHW